MGAFDDAFKTGVVDCRGLLYPLLNETFRQNYTRENEVVFYSTEFAEKAEDGSEIVRRISDSCFRMKTAGGEEHFSYDLECQSTADGQIDFRMYEYSALASIQQRYEEDGDVFHPYMHCAVINLRGRKGPAHNRRHFVQTEAGILDFPVHRVEFLSYALDQLFEKKLYLLLPFYALNYEKQMKQYDCDASELKKFQDMLSGICRRLDLLARSGEITEFEKSSLEYQMKYVLDHGIAVKYENVKKGVADVMSGKVLEYEAKTIYKKGIAEGEAKGEARGQANGDRQRLNSTIDRMIRNGRDDETILADTGATMEEIAERRRLMTPAEKEA